MGEIFLDQFYLPLNQTLNYHIIKALFPNE